MSLISWDNFKKNFNIGWGLLIIYLLAMASIYIIAKPSMPLGTEMYLTIFGLLLVGLALES